MIRNTIKGLIPLFVFVSCTKDLSITVEQSPPYFLNCILEVGASPKAVVGKALSVIDSLTFKYECDARSELTSEGLGNFRMEMDTSDGHCELKGQHIIQESKPYAIKVDINDVSLVSEGVVTPAVIQSDLTLLGISAIGEVIDEYRRETFVHYRASFRASLAPGVPIQWLGQHASLATGDTISKSSLSKIVQSRITSHPANDLAGHAYSEIQNMLTQKGGVEAFDFDFDFFINKAFGLTEVNVDVVIYHIEDNLAKYINRHRSHVAAANDPFAVPAPMFNNINGGYGIFGAVSANKKSIRVVLPQ